MESRSPRILPLVCMLWALIPLACASSRPDPVPSTQPERRPTQPTTAEELEAIRAVVLEYYEREKPESWETFVVELRRGAVFLADTRYEGSLPAVGNWRLMVEDGRFALVRQPRVPKEFPAVLVWFGVYLVREGEAWRVTEEYLLYDDVE